MSFLSRLNPTPSFPNYTGPYQVGTVDVEIAASDLNSPAPAPDPEIATVGFRIFYPCERPTGHERAVRWIPHPQRDIVSAYARFLGGGSTFAEVFSFFPQLLYYMTIPAHRNAKLLTPSTSTKRWPVVVFSHGLGGGRNTYSHICGSLASHGMVVVAPDHRDGSSPIQYVRATDHFKARTVDYRNYSHQASQEVYEGRDDQLRIRTWELGLAHAALLKIDAGDNVNNLDPNSTHHSKKESDRNEVLSMFAHSLDVHTPGHITWAGHSFGAATTVQFTKSVFWSHNAKDSPPKSYKPLFTASPSSVIAQQITASSPVALLDLWCLPLRSPSTSWLWSKPMPSYAPSGPGGSVILGVLSEAFFKWSGNLRDTQRALSPPSSSPNFPAPHLFYPATSAHLSQSDFGILFPWVTKRVFKAEEPERTLRLNTRAILQLLRENPGHIEVADTSAVDGEEEAGGEAPVGAGKGDERILRRDGGVRGWVYVEADGRVHNGVGVDMDEKKGPGDVVMEEGMLGEMKA
ncbi:hypothetical protein LTR04_001571 [Oleoguttula sp. CCFEE 6159]|nr:hypothetical protein LTR04_001571 [Oleoguttula sp. CCFEE 6159]